SFSHFWTRIPRSASKSRIAFTPDLPGLSEEKGRVPSSGIRTGRSTAKTPNRRTRRNTPTPFLSRRRMGWVSFQELVRFFAKPTIFPVPDRNLTVPRLFKAENQRFEKGAPPGHPQAEFGDLLPVGPVGYFAENSLLPERRQDRLKQKADGETEISAASGLFAERLQFPFSFEGFFLDVSDLPVFQSPVRAEAPPYPQKAEGKEEEEDDGQKPQRDFPTGQPPRDLPFGQGRGENLAQPFQRFVDEPDSSFQPIGTGIFPPAEYFRQLLACLLIFRVHAFPSIPQAGLSIWAICISRSSPSLLARRSA